MRTPTTAGPWVTKAAQFEELKHKRNHGQFSATAGAGKKPAGASRRPAASSKPSGQASSQQAMHDAILRTPGARKMGLTADILAKMRPDAVAQIASQLGIKGPAQPPPGKPAATPPPLPARPPALPHERTQATALGHANAVRDAARSGDKAGLHRAHSQAKRSLQEHLLEGMKAIDRMAAAKYPKDAGKRMAAAAKAKQAFRAKIGVVHARLNEHARGTVRKVWESPFDLCVTKAFTESEHPRGQPENAGEFASTGGGGSKKKPTATSSQPTAKESGTDKFEDQARKIVGGKLRPAKGRAWNGQPEGEPISKDLAGAIGEEVLIQYLRSQGYEDAGKTSDFVKTQVNNLPFDLIHDHQLIEAKGGQTGKPSGRWDLKYDGRFSKEQEAKLARMSPEKAAATKKKINRAKVEGIHARKEAFVQRLSKELGFKIKPGMMTVIINHAKKTADIYKFDGLFDSISWNSERAQNGYVTSVRYG